MYHAVSQGSCSRADVAKAVVRLTQGRLTVKPVTTSSWVTKRPANGRLSTVSLTQNGFAQLPVWETALADYLKEQM